MPYVGSFPNVRLRRLRKNNNLRQLIQETYLHTDRLISPLFIKHGTGVKNPVLSMPGHFQWSIDTLPEEIDSLLRAGIKQVMLFGIPSQKDSLGTDSYSDSGIIQTAIKTIKKIAPECLVISDICLCEYTDHGHCGVVKPQELKTEVHIDNDCTLELLAKQAVSHAKAGADIIAPSANMDGMVQAIRQALDQSDYTHLPIFSYSVKYASALYGPFRQAAEGAPKFGDRRTYQMDTANAHEALRECALDIAEGADMLMVKPAHTFLDIIHRIKHAYPALPLGAYHTSGEYVMIKAAAEKGWIDERQTALEILTAIKRAGADFIITYYAKEAASWLNH